MSELRADDRFNPVATPVLYDYWRSTACYRVRIVLNLKGVEYQSKTVNLVRDGGEQHQAAYRALNPQGLIPALAMDGQMLSQSMAICEYLEERFPEPALLPRDAAQRAHIRSLCQAISSDIHPINNLRIQQYLKNTIGLDDAAAVAWMNHWMTVGFTGIEATLKNWGSENFCYGPEPTLADCCLLPQVYNADRFGCDMAPFPHIRRVVMHCSTLPAFQAARPEIQPDAPASQD